METFSALLAICAGNSPVTSEVPAQRPVTRNFDVFFDLRPNKLLSKQSWGWWFQTPSRPLWRHRNGKKLTVIRLALDATMSSAACSISAGVNSKIRSTNTLALLARVLTMLTCMKNIIDVEKISQSNLSEFEYSFQNWWNVSYVLFVNQQPSRQPIRSPVSLLTNMVLNIFPLHLCIALCKKGRKSFGPRNCFHLLTPYTIILVSLSCRYIWKHLTCKTPVRYILSSVCQRCSLLFLFQNPQLRTNWNAKIYKLNHSSSLDKEVNTVAVDAVAPNAPRSTAALGIDICKINVFHWRKQYVYA